MRVEAIAKLTVVLLDKQPFIHDGVSDARLGLKAHRAQTVTMTFNSLKTLVSIMFDLKTSTNR